MQQSEATIHLQGTKGMFTPTTITVIQQHLAIILNLQCLLRMYLHRYSYWCAEVLKQHYTLPSTIQTSSITKTKKGFKVKLTLIYQGCIKKNISKQMQCFNIYIYIFINYNNFYNNVQHQYFSTVRITGLLFLKQQISILELFLKGHAALKWH